LSRERDAERAQHFDRVSFISSEGPPPLEAALVWNLEGSESREDALL
jgi:hypothetical protein